MARKRQIGAVLTLKDNFSATLRGVRKEQSQFKKDVQETRKAMEKVYKKKYDLRLNHTAAAKKIKELRKELEPLRKKVVTALAYKDMISRRIRTTKNKLKNLGRMTVAPIIKVKDMATRQISRIRGALGAVARSPIGMAAGGILAGAGIASAASLVQGANLEQQKISMRHFIGINNKNMNQGQVQKLTDSFVKQLRENANLTPFETSEVIAAGARAVGVAAGNTKEAMNLIKVAEDMAALTPGKTIKDAMEALADAKMGEMERLKEFNTKVSAEQFKKLGFKGVVDKLLKAQFAGGAADLSTSGLGLFSTIVGKLKTISQDFGFNLLDKLKPAMSKVIDVIDKWSPKITEKLNNAVDSGFRYIKKHYIDNKEFMSLSFAGKVKFVFNDITSGIKKWLKEDGGDKQLKDVGKTVGEYIASGMSLAAPQIAEAGIKIGSTIATGILDGLKKSPLASTAIGAYLGFRVAGPLGAAGGGAMGFINSIPVRKDIVIPNGQVDLRRVYPKLPKNARGTNFWRGGHTWVGENGPEIIDAPRGSKIYPHDKSVQMSNNAGQRPIEININGVGKSIKEIVNEMVPQLKLALANS